MTKPTPGAAASVPVEQALSEARMALADWDLPAYGGSFESAARQGGRCAEALRALLASQSAPAEAREATARELLDNWFAPWGSWKTEWWEDLSGDKPWDANTMLEIVHAALQRPTP